MTLIATAPPAPRLPVRGILWQEMSLLLLLTSLATVGTFYFHPYAPALYLSYEPAVEGEVSVAEASAAASQPGVIFIDARVRRFFDAGHIAAALSLCETEVDFQDQLLRVAEAIQAEQDKWVVVYCDGNKCQASHAIAEILRGIHPVPEHVKVLHGGWPAWQADAPK